MSTEEMRALVYQAALEWMNMPAEYEEDADDAGWIADRFVELLSAGQSGTGEQ